MEIQRYPAPNGEWVALVDLAVGSLVLEEAQGRRVEVLGAGSGVLGVRWSADSSLLAIARSDPTASPSAAADIWRVTFVAGEPQFPHCAT